MGRKAVQTLSHLKRAHPGNCDAFVLDFQNDTEAIGMDSYRAVPGGHFRLVCSCGGHIVLRMNRPGLLLLEWLLSVGFQLHAAPRPNIVLVTPVN